MTIPEQASRRVVIGVGSTPSLTHAYPLENSTHLEVWADDEQLVLGSHYTISGVGDPAGYTVFINDPSEWDPDRWVLNVRYPINQPSDVDLGGQFGQRIEDALDRMGRGQQTLDDLGRRALKMVPTTAVDTEYEVDTPIPNGFLYWHPTLRKVMSAELDGPVGPPGPVGPAGPPGPAGATGPAGPGVITLATNTALTALDVTGFADGVTAFTSRAGPSNPSGGGFWRLVTTPIIAENGVTVIDADDGRYWEKTGGSIDFPANPSQTTHAQSVACFEVRVPSDFATITAALDYLSNFYSARGGMVDIFLETGFVMQEQVWIFAQQFGWVTIFAEDSEVSIDTDFLTVNRTQDIYGLVSRAAFTIAQGGTGPRIGCIFDMGSPAHDPGLDRHGLLVTGPGSSCHVMNFRGFKNSGSSGIYANRGGYINCYGADVSGAATNGIYANRAHINCHNVVADNCGQVGILALYGAEVMAFVGSVDGCGTAGIRAQYDSHVEFNGGSADGCTLHGLVASNNSIINAPEASVVNAGGRAVFTEEAASTINFDTGVATGAGTYAVFASRGSTINASFATLTGAGTAGIWAEGGARVTAQAANARKGGVDDPTDIQCINGSTINANAATGGLNITANTVTAGGIIFQA